MKATDLYHRFYYQATGVYSPHYIPDDLYYNIIDRQFNRRIEAETLDNKCLYAILFPKAHLPATIGYRINGTWVNDTYHPIGIAKLKDKISKQNEIVFKLAQTGYGGKGVHFVSGSTIVEDAMSLASSTKEDIVIQKIITQHPEIAKLNPESINTVRCISFLSQGKAVVYSSVLRMGVNGNRVDNASSGGITCGITMSGRLKPVAYSPNGSRFYKHPTSGINFETIVVPGFSESIALVEQLHESFPMFRLISWDIAIDETAMPLLIEGNFKQGDLGFHQLNNGPLFGDDQEKVLSESNGKYQISVRL